MRNVLIAFGIVIGIGVAVLGLKSALHSDVRSARAEINTGAISAASISVYEMQAHARDLPAQDVKDLY
jgi:hypothetical protein